MEGVGVCAGGSSPALDRLMEVHRCDVTPRGRIGEECVNYECFAVEVVTFGKVSSTVRGGMAVFAHSLKGVAGDGLTAPEWRMEGT